MSDDLSQPWHHIVDVGIDPELMDHNHDKAPSDYTYPCVVCGQETPVEEPEAFDPSYHYCGHSPRCCP